MNNKLIIIVGPTASGKTALSIRLAKALDGEVVSADSMQIYRGMDIGTAKPTLEEMEGVPHHMLSVCDPGEEYSVSRYAQEADACVRDIQSRGKAVILCGGTGLYLNALVAGTGFQPQSGDAGLRETLNAAWDRDPMALWRELEQADPESAAKLHPNDKKRVTRALEVWRLTGETISAHNRRTQSVPPRYDSVWLGLKTDPRQILYDRIDSRVTKMLEQGLLEETRALLEQGKLTGTAAQAIGYKELLDHFAGNMTLEQAADLIRQKSRNYAKRQLSWFGGDSRVNWIVYNKPEAGDQVFREATDFLHQAGLQF